MTSNSYIFRVNDVLVHNCRSKGDHNDSDWMHLYVWVNDLLQEPTGLFNIGDNIHAGDELQGPWEVGPYLISDEDKVSITLTVENLSHTPTAEQIGEAIKIGTLIVAAVGGVASALASAAKDEADAILNAALAGVIGTAGEVLGWIVGTSDPNCNGEILSQSFFFERGELAQRAPFTIPNEYTSRSPSECGNDPHTHLSFTALPVAPPPRVTHEFLAGVNADHTIQVFQFTPAGGWTTGRIGWASVAGPLTSWVAGGTWHLAGLGTDDNVYVLWQSPGHDWQAANITSAARSPADTRAPLTSWVAGESEFLAGVNADHTIQVFQFTPAGGWTTGRIGWASVAGPLTSWVAGGTWHLAGLGTDDNVYVLWQSPGHDWQAANITSAVRSPADTRAPLTSWVAGESEFLAGVNADHTIQVFQFTPAGGWTTGRIGWASVAGPLTSWVAGGAWHLAGLGTDDNVYVLWQSLGHDWQAVNISAIAGSRVKPPMTAWQVNDVEHLAGLDAAGQPVVFWWSPAHDWQATKTTTGTGQPIGDGLQSWIIPI